MEPYKSWKADWDAKYCDPRFHIWEFWRKYHKLTSEEAIKLWWHG